jgi:uncharacterized phage protein (TIGR01671 family)
MSNREIKFRIWSKSQSIWATNVNGLPISISLSGDVVFSDFDEGTNKTEIYTLGDSFIAQQSTGLKDKNGKEIYEGDIIKYIYLSSQRTEEKIVYITRHTELARFCTSNWDGLLFSNKMEIIGNIYENPELLKKS